LKLGVVPKDAAVKWTSDGSDPANHGAPYPAKGIEAKEGGTVKVYAEKAGVHTEVSFPVPKEKKSGGEEDPVPSSLDLEKPASLASGALRSLDLVSRLNVHSFLTKLPQGAVLVGSRAKSVKAETDNRVALVWDAKTRLEADRILKAFDFLDGQLPDAEWELEATGGVIFPSGRALIEWQKDNSIKIAPGLVTQ
jgi:hypothetical protein